MRRALVLPFLPALSACDNLKLLSPPDPAVAYMTAASHPGRCGYDWNGAGVEISAVPRLAREWKGGKDAAFLFRFDRADDSCVEPARSALLQGGFRKVWIVEAAQPGPGEVLVPHRW